MDGQDFEEEEQVMSEVHLGCPPAHSGPHLSRFTISLPPGFELTRCGGLFKEKEVVSREHGVFVDEDGDLVLARRHDLLKHSLDVTIRHNITSSIPNVGLQVWKAELLLSDFVLHKMFTSFEFDGIIALELGAGTDRGGDILDNCVKNVECNANVLKYQGSVHVRELDWFTCWPPTVSHENSAHNRRYSWTSSEVDEAQKASLLLAADVIYSDDLTDALFNMLERLMSVGSEKVLYLALEKRYNFSLNDLNVVANGYSKFLSYLREVEFKHTLGLQAGVDVADGVECQNPGYGCSQPFVCGRVDHSLIPQYVGEYDRGNDLELWQIMHTRVQNNRFL